MNRIKRFLGTALTYLAGNILSKMVTFFLLPLYTNKLTTVEYGDYDVISTVVTLLVSVAFFQIWDGMFRISFDVSDEDEKYKIIGICFKGYGLGIALFSILFYIVSALLSFQQLILPYIFGIMFGLQYMYSFASRVFLRNKLFVTSGVANTLTNAVINIFLIVFFQFGVKSLYIAQILGCAVQVGIIEAKLHIIPRLTEKTFSFETYKRIIKFSIPLCIATISYWLLSGFTKIVINKACGPEDNGLFAIASSLANVAVIAVNVFQFAWNEMAYLMANEVNRTATYKKCIDLLFCTVWLCCAAFCTVVNIIFPYYIGEAFQASSKVIPYLMIGVSANAIAGFLGTLFMTEQKTSFIMISTFFAAAINVAFAGLAANRFGLLGAVVVLSCSFLVLMFLRLFQIRRKMKISVSFASFLCFIPVAVAIILYSVQRNLIVNSAFLVALLVAYCGILPRLLGVDIFELIRAKMKR